MKLIERIRRDRAEMAELDRNAKLLFLWDYYKIPILAVVCAVLLTAVTVLTSAGSGRAAMYAVFVNTFTAEGDRAALDSLLEENGVELKGRHIDVTANLTLGQELDELGDAQSMQVLAALFGISGLDFFAADETAFARYASQGAFVDLVLFLAQDTLDQLGDDCCYTTASDGTRTLTAIRLHPDSPLHKAGYYVSDVCVGIAANAENLEEAITFLKALLP